jgi:glycerate dehydrogenase
VAAPNIVVLDGYTTNPGDLSWEALERLGALTVHERTAQEHVVSALSEAELALTNKVQLTSEILQALPQLKYIGILATGTNAVDLKAASAQGIVVCNVPRYSTDSVAQLVFEALLDAATHAHDHRNAVRNGAWETAEDFCFNVATVRELAGKTLGIVGYGTIGQKVAHIARAFGMNVLVAQSLSVAAQPPPSAMPRVPLPELLRAADFVTLHCPLTPTTRGLIGKPALAAMKNTSFLINTARGPLIDEAALAMALDRGQIAGAYLDVLSEEPPAPQHPLLHHPLCKVTPHIGWTSFESRERLLQLSADNIAAFLRGTPIHVVS